MEIKNIATVKADSVPQPRTRTNEVVEKLFARVKGLAPGQALQVDVNSAKRWSGYSIRTALRKRDKRVEVVQRGNTLYISLAATPASK